MVGGWESWESGTLCQFGSLALVAEFLVADVPSQEILLGFVFHCQYGVLVDFGEK